MSPVQRILVVLLLAAGCGSQLVEFNNSVPTVVSCNPADNATTVGVSTTVTAVFSEPMDPASIHQNSFTLKRGTTPIAGAVTYSGNTATFTPAAALPSDLFTATISVGAKSLASRNPLAAPYVWTFTTAGAAVGPPSVTSIDPGNLATGVVLNKRVTATFSKPMDPATISGATFTLKQGTLSIDGTVTYAGPTATFTPTSTFAPNTVYSAAITIGAKDTEGTALTADYAWSFTTGATIDTTPPRVIATNPLDNAKGTCPNTKIIGTFDGRMDPLTIAAANFTLTSLSGVPASPVAVNGSVTYDAVNHAATLTPAADLALNTQFTATLTTGVKSDTGIALAADKVWTFTTAAKVCQLPVNLRSLATFVAVAGAGITNSNSAGVTLLGGDVGLSPTGTCMSDGIICDPAASKPKITGTLYANDPGGIAAQAKADLVLAYNDACETGFGTCPGPGRPPGTLEADLSGMVLAPGVYTSESSMMIAVNGTLVLDGQGDSNAVWIFQVGSALTVNNGAKVLLINGAKAANVFWAIGSSSTLGGGVSFKGTVLARASNSVGTGSVVEGRLVCTDGAITLLSDTITLPAP